MAWVKEQYITVEGFPKALLKHIRAACEAHEVEWLTDSLIYHENYSSEMLEWKGCTFRVTEMNGSIREVCLINSDACHEDLTALVLKII
jgi:hypothetical protein